MGQGGERGWGCDPKAQSEDLTKESLRSTEERRGRTLEKSGECAPKREATLVKGCEDARGFLRPRAAGRELEEKELEVRSISERKTVGLRFTGFCLETGNQRGFEQRAGRAFYFKQRLSCCCV